VVKRLVIMLVGAGIVFGGIFGFIIYRDAAIARAIANRQPPAIPVTVANLQPIDWISTIPSIGLLESVQGVDVTSEIAGLIIELKFDSGQEVRHDDVLVRLDDSVEQGQLRQAQAQLPALQSNLTRYRALGAQGNAPVATLDNAQSQFDAMRQNIDALQATVARKTIRAPFDGILGVRRVNLGQLVNPGTVIANLQNITAMRVSLIITQRDFARIQVGHPVEATVDAYPGRRFSGNVIAIEPSVNAQSGIVRVQAEISNGERLLRAGMMANVEVILPQVQHVIAVPASAITFTLYGNTAFVVRSEPGPDGHPRDVARRVSVETGERRGIDVVVTSGLSAGDRVVTLGQLRLDNGSPVETSEQDLLRPPAQTPVQ
jgi:membrane fusion protein (multidrug efflux system)